MIYKQAHTYFPSLQNSNFVPVYPKDISCWRIFRFNPRVALHVLRFSQLGKNLQTSSYQHVDVVVDCLIVLYLRSTHTILLNRLLKPRSCRVFLRDILFFVISSIFSHLFSLDFCRSPRIVATFFRCHNCSMWRGCVSTFWGPAGFCRAAIF